jgi:DNA-binding beta-propeller fold protein YncE
MLTLSKRRLAAAMLLSLVAGCANGSTVPPTQSAGGSTMPLSRLGAAKEFSILKMLKKQVVIGSTIDPKFGQLNPYGLTVAPSTTGDFTKGDLVVCNFNAKNNVQGTGFTIVALHPKPGSKPLLVSDSKTLTGCNALALGPADDIWAAAFSANDNPVISATGKLEVNIKGKPFDRPFGQAFAQPTSGSPAFYASNAGNGEVIRINLGSKFTYDVIATGFAVNHGKPGGIFGPSGLTYDPNGDQLYVVDGTNNTVVAFSNVSAIPQGGIKVGKGGKTFSGPSAKDARLVFAGSPLNGPISAALLPNGNIVVGNTGNPSGQNLMVELSASGKLMDVRNVDKGASGALFGIVATGMTAGDTKVYFNDDNDNNLQVLER